MTDTRESNSANSKIERLLSKYQLEIYRGDSPHCSEILFTVDDGFSGWWHPDGYKEKDYRMMFRTTEETAAPLLAVIESVIPDSYDYYYDTLPVRKRESALIYAKMQDVRLKILNDPLDPSLGEIAECLRRSEFAHDRRIKYGPLQDCEQKALHLRRYELAALYKLFMKWLHPEKGIFVDFVVTGP